VTATTDRDPRPPAKRVARNTVLRAIADVIGKVASLVLFAFIARALGVETLGNYVLALSVVQLIWALSGFGLDQMALRDIARDRTVVEDLFFDVITFKLVIGTLVLVATTIGVAAIGYSREVVVLVAILGASGLLMLLSSTAQAVFQAHEQMEYYLMAYVPNKILAAVIGIVVLAAGAGIVAVAIGALAATAVGFVVALVLLYRFFARPRARLRLGSIPSLFRAAFPFGFEELTGVILYRADVVLLSLLTTSIVVGNYGAAYRLLEGTFFLAWSVGSSILPMFSYLSRDTDPTLDRVLEGALKLITVVLTPIAVTLLVCAKPVIDLFFGLPEYAAAVPVLRWLSLATLAYALASIGGLFVLVHHPPRVTVAVFGSAAVLNIALNLALIPPLGAVGSAVATLASEVCLVVALIFLATRVVDSPRWASVAGGAVLAGCAMAAAMVPLATHLWLALPVGLLVYLGILLAFEARHIGGDIGVVRELLSARSKAGAVSA
jgi:O-antigen/teichoic acid export membrane protein